MSDKNIPLEIQMEIIKKVYDVKSLIRFRSVSKLWKSFIDSPEFIKGYGARHTQPHSRILSYKSRLEETFKHICLVDDDIETFKVKQQELAPSIVSHLLEQYHVSYVVGACHGLFCLYGRHKVYNKSIVVIWNPSIQKSFGIAIPRTPIQTVYGFGVCPVTSDPTVVKVVSTFNINMPWHVEVFTLSSGVWNVIPSSNLPRQSIELNPSTQVVIDRFIYWGAREKTSTVINHMVVSFDLITKEFKVVNLPDSLRNELILRVSVSKLKGSLVVYGYIWAEGAAHCGVWVMEHDSSFRKLFSIGAGASKILGFRKNGEPIFDIRNAHGQFTTLAVYDQFTTLAVYDPCSQQIKNFGISGVENSFFMDFYKESLLLLDHSDSHIYMDHN